MADKINIKNFSWHGVNAQGLRATGTIAACNRHSARSILCQQNITVITISRRYRLPITTKNRAPKQTDITEFSLELATLISAGIPLATALRVASDSARKPAMQHLINELLKQIEGGCLLSEALKSQAHYFDGLYCGLVYVSEQSGTLEQILQRIAQHREKAALLRKKIEQALFYPSIVLFISLLVICALMIWVMPQFTKLFQSAGAELPWLTQAVIHGTASLQQHSLGLCTGATLGVVLSKYATSHLKSWRHFLDRFWLQWPLLGALLQEAVLARCFSTLAITLGAGLPILEVLQLTSKVAGHIVYSQGFTLVAQQVKNGQALHQAFQQVGLFPSKAVQMLRIGEEAGQLDYMLQKLSDYFEQRVNHKVQTLSQLIEPVLMVFLSVIVGTLLIAMYLPIFRLGTVL